MCSLLFNVGKHINITNLLRRLVIFQEKDGIGGEGGGGGGGGGGYSAVWPVCFFKNTFTIIFSSLISSPPLMHLI